MEDIDKFLESLEHNLPTPECRPDPLHGHRVCMTHHQQMAACWQMAHGTLCSGCHEWHDKNVRCTKVN